MAKCRYCGEPLEGRQFRHRCADGAAEAYAAQLLQQVEDEAARLGQVTSIRTKGQRSNKLLPLWRKALRAGVSLGKVADATSRGWARHGVS